MNFRFLMVTAAVMALTSMAHAAGLSGEILEFGYYEVQTEGERFQDPNATSGTVMAGPTVKLLQQTNVIPIETGRMFGFRFRLSGFPAGKDVEIREVVKHPPIVTPDKKKSTGFESRLALNVEHGTVTDYAGYRMDHDYEMVEGEWRFEFWYDDKKLLEQKFTTTKAAAMPSPLPPPASAPSQPAGAR